VLLRPLLVAAATAAAFLALTASAAAHLDHPAPAFSAGAPVGTGLNSGGPGASWELITTFPTGNPHTDLDFFTQGGETYAAVGTLATGANAGGQTIFRLTRGGNVRPSFVASHPSASCVSDPVAALGLQHDVEATPKGNVILNTDNPSANTSDAQLLVDATDNEGRCHDAATGGIAPTDPQGGLEIIDITDVDSPVEIGLTSHIGEAHTVNIDPKRPHIAFAVTSDSVSVTCNADDTSCTRANENPASSQRFNLDGFEVVDLSSCMNFAPLTSATVKRMRCRPQVYRYRYPSALIALGHTVDGLAGCHELEIYPDDKLTCASVNATIVFDLSGAFDDNGTPNDFTDDKPRGQPLPCRVRDSSSPAPYARPQALGGVAVVDCVVGEDGQDLTVPGWLAIGAPSLTGVQHVGTAFHQGRGGPNPSTEDVDVSHEAELSGSRRLVLATDERGGGVTPPGATCAPAFDNVNGNGGINAYQVDELQATTPSGPDAAAAETAWQAYARTPSGGKAIYRAPIHTGPQSTLCTAHVFQQVPGQNRIFMGWYTQGTHVVDFVEHPDGTVSFKEAGWFIPENANTWTSAVFKLQENPDGTFTYWGATGDFNLGAAGRSAVDIWKVTLPAPPRPFGQRGAALGDRATGGGWLADNQGKKINFGFRVEQTEAGPDGDLRLNDKPVGVKIELTDVDSLGPVEPGCGSVTDGPSSLEFRGSGTYNGTAASFRVCVSDGGEGAGAEADRFYLACTTGCTYTTGARAADDAIDGGNIHVRRSATATAAGEPRPVTAILDPVLLTEGALGQAQIFSVAVYDQNQEPLANAGVTLTRTSAGGGVQTFTALTDLTGNASILVTNLAEPAEYRATAGEVQSNAVEVTPVGG
jgi:hypothetical protein